MKQNLLKTSWGRAYLTLLLTLIVLLIPHNALAQAPSVAHRVKASLLFNFLSFVEWPVDAFEQHPEDLTVCVWGDDQVKQVLETIRGEIVKGRRLSLLSHQELNEVTVKECNVVYLAGNTQIDPSAAIQIVGDSPVLTVTDLQDAANNGGMIAFTLRDNKVGFNVNAAAAKRSRLVLSSHLLKLAQEVLEN